MIAISPFLLLGLPLSVFLLETKYWWPWIFILSIFSFLAGWFFGKTFSENLIVFTLSLIFLIYANRTNKISLKDRRDKRYLAYSYVILSLVWLPIYGILGSRSIGPAVWISIGWLAVGVLPLYLLRQRQK